jgi:plastocyanin
MRPHRLLLPPLTLLLVLAAAAPASAMDWTVDVTPDFAFAPKDQTIQVGDTVKWTFTDGGHTTTARPDQPDSWNSGLKEEGQTFEKTFTTPGRYQYICKPHRDFMRGTIVVGTDKVKKTVGKVKAKAKGSTGTVSFKLNEAAVATWVLKGPKKKTVSAGRLKAGKHTLKAKKLKAGKYKGTLKLSDDFDNEVSPKTSFKVR